MAELTASPVRTEPGPRTLPAVPILAAAAGAQVALLGLLAMLGGLGLTGWLTGLAYAVLGVATLAVTSHKFANRSFGPADLVTLGRAVLAGGVTALVLDGTAPLPLLLTTASIALALDAIDGRIARRTNTISPYGARFDMEVDAFLILVLSVQVATDLGSWVLAIGAMRYLFAVASSLRGWLRAPLPPSLMRKTVAAVQGVVLAVAASDLLPRAGTVAVVALALASLLWSFGRDLVWLRRRRVVEPKEPTPLRRALGRVATALACLLVLFALLLPNDLSLFIPATFARLPIEAILIAGLALVLPPRPRRITLAVIGTGLGLLTIIKFFDMGFNETLARPFDPVFDWSFLRPGVEFLAGSVGRLGAVLAVTGAAALVIAVIALMTWSVLRMSKLVVSHRSTSARTVLALGLVWAICAVFGVQLSPDTPVAARSAASAAYGDIQQIRAGLLDPQAFAREAADDAYRHTPGDELLTKLRGKDVLLVFVESYGRVAVEDPQIAPRIDPILDDGTTRLSAAGFDSRSAFVESSTSGGGSWFAHATMQSGLWINNQQRYDALTTSGRLSLTRAFGRAGWHTVSVAPANTRDWPEGRYYGFDQFYDANSMAYQGPTFAYSKMPDQYTMAFFQRQERNNPNRPPVMAEIDLTSSHTPWVPLPTMVPWEKVGDGSVFNPQPAAGEKSTNIWPDPTKVRHAFANAIEYSLTTLISYIETHGDDNLVMIMLGDHQPAPIVTGKGASWDAPITIITRDKSITALVDNSWEWQPGMNPTPTAPIWRMDTFRDRFLQTFGPPTNQSRTAALNGNH